MRVSIIVRTLNEARHLPDLLDAIERQTITSAQRETIVVDSGSTDGTVAIAERHGCRVVAIAREDFSFGRSLNLGCAAASAPVLAFISGHCVPISQDWLENLITPIEQNAAALTYGRQKGGQTTRFSERQIFRKYFPESMGQAPNGFFCNNANAALKRNLWDAYRFDENLTGLEDLHIAKRLTESGHKIRYVPDAAVFHYHAETWRQVKRRFEREALALQIIMPEVHVEALTAFRYFTIAAITDLRKAAREGQFFENAWPIVAYRFCQYYGSWKGNHHHRKLSRETREQYFYPE